MREVYSKTENYKTKRKAWQAANKDRVRRTARALYWKYKRWRDEAVTIWESVLTARLADTLKRFETGTTTDRPVDKVLAAHLWQKLHGPPGDEARPFSSSHRPPP